MHRLLAVFLVASPALAQDPSWPAEFNRVVSESAGFCEGEFSLAEGTVTRIDLSGDGMPDWLLDTAGFTCSTTPSLYCGILGCTVYTEIDGAIGMLTLKSWEVVTEQGETFLTAPDQQGQPIRYRWTGTDWEQPD
ncbi:hypothetical protein [Tabrizicola sp. YIM 78059]|uniref:hypothetical protein n=1 Tax=Tabrizicola sp. YIM 78059 TaxID=2529861 RepID=UPI0010AA0515|nr:hypothetical protein [Tabrizicola sp. YIM 78059]